MADHLDDDRLHRANAIEQADLCHLGECKVRGEYVVSRRIARGHLRGDTGEKRVETRIVGRIGMVT